MVVEDPRNGQVLALATYPDYNPSDFLGGISEPKWKYYNNPANNFPLIDRAISTGYAPGFDLEADHGHGHDALRLAVAVRLLRRHRHLSRSAARPSTTTTTCRWGRWTWHRPSPSRATPTFTAWAASSGSRTTPDALLKGPDPLQAVASQYGFGHYSGIDLPGRRPRASSPTPRSWPKSTQQYPKDYPDGVWEPGFEVQEAIGEGQDSVTPLQLANAYATFANGGTLYVPDIALAVEAPGTGRPAQREDPQGLPPTGEEPRERPVPVMTAQAMLQGFEGVTANPTGTAYNAFTSFPLAQYPVAGKTGTAQVDDYCAPYTDLRSRRRPWPAYKQDTSVFASFAPADRPPLRRGRRVRTVGLRRHRGRSGGGAGVHHPVRAQQTGAPRVVHHAVVDYDVDARRRSTAPSTSTTSTTVAGAPCSSTTTSTTTYASGGAAG